MTQHDVTGLTNAEFLERHGAPGRIGLAGGELLIERAIRRVQRHLREDRSPSPWSHAFIFTGRREDGWQWVLESDLEIHRRQIRLGVQENRVAKYHDERAFANLAVLDFGLGEAATRRVLSSALDLLAGQVRYSLGELVGTLLALRKPALRTRRNLLDKDNACYCSAMVAHAYRAASIDFTAGVVAKHITPEDIAASAVPHEAWVMARSPTLPRLLHRRRKA